MALLSGANNALAPRPVEEWRGILCKTIAEVGHLRRYKRKELVFGQGEAPDGVYAVKDGLVDLSAVNEFGREVSYSFRTAGECFGFSEIILGEPRFRSAVTLADTELWFVSSYVFLKVIQSRPDVVFAMLASTLHRFTRYNEMRVDLRGHSAEHRIAYSLVRLAKQVATPSTQDCPVTLHITHEELSRLCDMSRQTVTAILNNLEQLGIVELESRRIILHDMRQLENRCGQSGTAE